MAPSSWHWPAFLRLRGGEPKSPVLDPAAVERRRRWQWRLASVLLVGLSLTIVVLVTSRPEGAQAPLPGGSSGYLGGMVGLVVLFLLYVNWQHEQLVSREAELRRSGAREEVLRERLGELASLLEVSSALSQKLDLKVVLSLAASRVLPCLEADHSSVHLFNPHTGCLDEVASFGKRTGLATPVALRPGEGVLGLVYASREALTVDSPEMRARLAGELGLAGTPHAALCVPIRFKNADLGVLSVARLDTAEPFAAVHARALQALAEQCGAAIVKDFHYQRAARRSRPAA